MGVLRDRLGEREDQFFSTVFLGSGLLLLAMLFSAAAVVGAIIIAFHADPEALEHSADLSFRTRAGLWHDQHLSAQDRFGIHGYDFHDCPLHSLDAPLARNRRIRHSGHTTDRLPWLEPDGISVLGSVGQLVHPMGN